MQRFRGWIPTVSGCLSFSIFGENDFPRKVVSNNVANAENRYIISWQKRLLTDTVLPFKELTSGSFLKEEGVFWCVCVASCGDNPVISDNKLSGTLYLFHGKKMWHQVERDIIEKQRALSSHLLDGDSEFQIFQESLISKCSYYAKFNLSRNGDTEIVSPENLDSFSELAPNFPKGVDARNRQLHMVSSQLFFFLKDIAHHHQHHAPTTDTMIDIYTIDGDDDYNWRCSTLRVLLRKILEFKRSTDIGSIRSSLGVLAYTNSFCDISKKVLNRKLSPKFNKRSLEQSIKATDEIKSLVIQKRIRAQELFRNLFFSFLGIVFAVIGLARVAKTPIPIETVDPLIVEISSFVIGHLLLSILFLGLFILAGMLAFRAIDYTEWIVVRNFYRILQALKLKISVIILSGTCIVSFYIVFKLIISILK